MVKKVNAIWTNGTSDTVKKADYSTKVRHIEKKIPNHDKHITCNEFYELRKEKFAKRLKQAKLATQNDLNTAKQYSIKNEEKNRKITNI